MKMIKGEWLDDERVVNGAGRLARGPIQLPEHLAEEFTRQGRFKPTPAKKMKEIDDVRATD